MNSTRLKAPKVALEGASSADWRYETKPSLELKQNCRIVTKLSDSLVVTASGTLQWRLQMTLTTIVLIALWTQCVTANKHDTESHYRSPHHYSNESSSFFENLIDDDYNDDRSALTRSLTETVPIATDDASHLLNLHSSTNQLISSSPTSSLSIENTERVLATDHYRYIKNHFSCSVPRPKLVKVKDLHNLNEEFIPRCTVLHRCDDETGCCENPTQKCEPERTELVDLYFYVRLNTVNNVTGGNNVEVTKLRFLNHTKCACKSINNKPRNLQPTRSPIKTYVTQRPKEQQRYHSERSTLYGGGEKTRHDIHQKCKNVIKHCPEPFVKRFREVDRRCVCECFSSSSTSERAYDLCQRIKSGTAQLEETWARCVRNASCAKPECNINFDYSAEQSGCLAMNTATKHHQFRQHHHRHHHHRHHHHRHRRHPNHLQQLLQSLQSRHQHPQHNHSQKMSSERLTDDSDSDLQHHLSTDWSD